jgi:hypothetical protein
MTCSRVDLPTPDCPIIAISSPACDFEIETAQHHDLAARIVETFVHPRALISRMRER